MSNNSSHAKFTKVDVTLFSPWKKSDSKKFQRNKIQCFYDSFSLSCIPDSRKNLISSHLNFFKHIVFDKSYKFISFSKTAVLQGSGVRSVFFCFFFFAKTVPLRSLIHRLPYSANSNNFVHYFLTTNRSNHSPWLTTLARVVEELSLEMTIANHSRCHNRVSTKNGWGRFERVQSVWN